MSSLRSRDPYAAADVGGKKAVNFVRALQRRPVVMGPCFSQGRQLKVKRAVLQIQHDTQKHQFCYNESVIEKSEIILASSGKSVAVLRPARAHQRGRFAVVTERWRGLRWTLWRQVIFHRTKRWQRTAKSCGPGAATLASIHAAPWWRGNGDNKGRSPGRARSKP